MREALNAITGAVCLFSVILALGYGIAAVLYRLDGRTLIAALIAAVVFSALYQGVLLIKSRND